MRIDSAADLIALMAAMDRYGISVLKAAGVYIKRQDIAPSSAPQDEWCFDDEIVPPGGLGDSPSSAEPPSTLSSASPTQDEVPVDIELELKELALENLKITDPYEYEQALMRDEFHPSKEEDET